MPEVEEYEDILALRREIPTIYLDYADDAHYVAEAVIGSDWLAAHDREVAARAVEVAQDRLVSQDQFSERTLRILDELAAALRSGPEGSGQ